MTTFLEGDLEISFSGATHARKFDGPSHNLSQCMKAVDFIVEFPDKFLFVELKDPEHPNAPSATTAQWIRDFQDGNYDNDLIRKFRDSWIYEWAAGRANKPVFYYVLVAISSQHVGSLVAKTTELRRNLPSGLPPNAGWVKQIVLDCQIFSIQSWNMNLPEFPVRRLSSDSAT